MVHRPTLAEVRSLHSVPRLAFLDDLPLPEADSVAFLTHRMPPKLGTFVMPRLSGTAWFMSEVSLLGFFLYAQQGKVVLCGEPLDSPVQREKPEMRLNIEPTERTSGHIRRCHSNLFEPFTVLIEDDKAHLYWWAVDQIQQMCKNGGEKFSLRFKTTASLAVLGRCSPWISIVGQGTFVRAVNTNLPLDATSRPVTRLELNPDLLNIELYPQPVMTEQERYEFLVGMLMNRSLFMDMGDVGTGVLWHGSSVHTQEDAKITASKTFAQTVFDHLKPGDFRTWFVLAMGEWVQ